MIGFEWLYGAALAAAQTAAFPCDKLAGELLEIYEGFESVPAPSRAPVRSKEGGAVQSHRPADCPDLHPGRSRPGRR